MAVKPSKPGPASTSGNGGGGGGAGASAVPALVPQGTHEGKPAMPLGRPVTVIGSRNRAHLHLLSRTVSKSHALVVNTSAGVYIRDLASRTHVLVNNKLVKEAELKHGDVVQVGSFLFKFSNPGGKNWKKPATPAPPATLDIADDDQPAMPFEGRVMLIGRRPTSDIPLLEPAVSTTHAVIFEINGQRYIRDLGSRTGTFVNGVNVHQSALAPNDLIRIGDTEMRYVLESAEPQQAVEEEPDELDHLMRTAPLAPQEAAEITRPPVAPAPASRVPDAGPIPLADDDRIPIEPEAPAPVSARGTAAAMPPAAPSAPADDGDLADFGLLPEGEPTEEHPGGELDLIPIEPTGLATPQAPPAPPPAAAEEDQLDEIDIFGEEEASAPAAPTPFPQPAAPPPPPPDAVNIRDDERQLLVDTDLRAERLSSSGSFTPIPVEADEEEVEPADVTVHPEDAVGAAVESPEAEATPFEPVPTEAPHEDEVQAEPAVAIEPAPPPSTFEPPAISDERAAAPAPLPEAPGVGFEEPAPAAAPTAEADEAEEDWLDLAIEQVQPPTAAETAAPEAEAAAPEPAEWAPAEPIAGAPEATIPPAEPLAAAAPPVDLAATDEDWAPDATDGRAPLPVERAMEDLDFALESPVAGPPPTAAPEPVFPAGEESPSADVPPGLSDVEPALPPLDLIEVPPVAAAPAPLPEPAPIEAPPADLAVVEPLAAAPAAVEAIDTVEDVALDRPPAVEAEPELDLAGLVVDESDLAPVEPAPDLQAAVAPPPAFPAPVADETDIATASVVPDDDAGPALGDDVALAPPDVAASALDDEPAALGPAAPPVEVEPAGAPPVAGPVMASEADLDGGPELDAGLDASSYTDLRASRILSPEETGPAAPPPSPIEAEEADAGLDASSYTDLRASRILSPAETGLAPPVPPPAAPLDTPQSVAETELGAEDLDDLLADDRAVVPAPAPEPTAPPSPVTEAPPKPASPPAPAPDLMRGMTRDIGSFIGGMPLSLPPAAPPPRPPRPAKAPPPPRRGAAEAGLDEFVLDEAGAMLQEFEGLQSPPAAAPPAPPAGRAAAPATPPPARGPRGAAAPTPPPPARSAGPRGGFGQEVDAPAAGVAADWDAAAPFAAGAPGRVTTAFDGLAMPPVAEADVFWQMPLGGGAGGAAAADVPLGTGPGAAVEVPRSPSRSRPGAPASDAGPDLADGEAPQPGTADDFAVDDADEAPAAGEGLPFEYRDEALEANLATAGAAADRANAALGVDRRGAGDRRPPAATPPAPPHPQTAPPRRGLGNRVWFFIILVVIAAIVAIWLYKPWQPKANVSGSLQFERLDRYAPEWRAGFARAQAERLRDPRTQARAAEILHQANASLAAGFLAPAGTADALAYERLADSAAIDEKGTALVVSYQGADARGDRARLRALLQALYEANQPMAEEAQKSLAEYETKRQELARLAAEIESADRDRLAARDRVDVDPAVQREALRRVQDEAERLGKRYGDALTAVGRLQADLQLVEATLPSPGDDAPAAVQGRRGANNAAVAAVSSDEDPQLLDMTQKLQDLSASLAQRKKARDAQAEEARKSLDAALAQFDREIKAAAQKNKGESQLGRYLAAAQRIQNTIRKLNDELTARNMATYDRLNSLKGIVAQENNQRIREAWANDPDLKNLERELAMKERRRNAAAGTPGMKAEAAKLQDDIDRINTEIEARRDLLVTADGQAGHIKAMEQALDETLRQMQASQQKDDQTMRDLLAELSHEAPQLEGLPAEQKAQAEQLERRSEELNKARAAYTAAMTAATAQADEQIGGMEKELTQLQARLDARRGQLVQQASGALSADQVAVRRRMAEQKRQELAAAKQAEADARAAYVESQQKLLAAESEAKALVAQRDSYQTTVNRLGDLRGKQQRLKAEFDRAEKAAANAILPKPPGEDAVTVVQEPDRLRWGLTFVLGTVAVGLCGFMLLANLRTAGGAHSYGPPMGDEPAEAAHRATQEAGNRTEEAVAV